MKAKIVTSGNRLYRKHWLKTIDPAKRVYVYRNLHKNCWSVRQSGKVVDHTHFLLLRDCRYLVGEAGRERVRREKKKNVHAGISGYVVYKIQEAQYWADWGTITYDPYHMENFALVSADRGLDPVYHSNYCIIDSKVTAVWTYDPWRDFQ